MGAILKAIVDIGSHPEECWDMNAVNQITKPVRHGIFPDISMADYHSDKDSYSSSLIKLMDVPALAKHYMDSPEEYKECYRIGSAIHKYVLERESFNKEFLTGIDRARRSNADREEWSAWFTEHGANGSDIITKPAAEWNGLFEQQSGNHMATPEEIKMIGQMAESVMRNEKAAQLLVDGVPEQSIYWTDEETGLQLRCRPDYLNQRCSDLKSCQSARDYFFAAQIARMGYHVSHALYQDGIYAVTGVYAPFLFIAIEKTPPYLCATHGLSEEYAEIGYKIYRKNLQTLAECLASGKWPGLNDNLEIAPPRYLTYEDD